uniref:Helicase domino n=1 Tax=Soboliphyme baturini TaxID=241478 RepID=A0A183IH08_9BILA
LLLFVFSYVEALVLRRVAELRRNGLWSARKLPKCAEPPRSKTHWDYLLEEMLWMSIDFAQERKWKKAACKKVCFEFIFPVFPNYASVFVTASYFEFESSEDEESTVEEAEQHEKTSDVLDEIEMLKKESQMDIDELLDSLPNDYFDRDENSSSSSDTTQVRVLGSVVQNMLMSSLARLQFILDCWLLYDQIQELTQIAEAVEKLQPKGHTLETTNVVTPIPFLLKHSLREYQHVGLDWLVTLFERELNGILADEMGLGKTIQTIALLAHLACAKGIWGPHLIVVPTSVMINWEMELKKWCPAFKILAYYGSLRDRKEKRKGWSKPNAFHVCITSYKLVLQDHLMFRRKKWEYLILDEAQHIKNFKSQRWQTLLNFNANRRLLLTGTPLQNSLMELWSLMHFLMPHIFACHSDFRDWFSNPLTDMIEGSVGFNEQIVTRLHKVLRPFLLRRLKSDVEKQLPKKVEHIVRCPLSKRQRYLYDDFLSRSSTKSQISSGNVMSVINVLMQLRKVCNHPNLFEQRPIISPLVVLRLRCNFPSMLRRIAPTEVRILFGESSLSLLTLVALFVPPVCATGVAMDDGLKDADTCSPWDMNDALSQLSAEDDSLHFLHFFQNLQFPERRLIEYDCGKLQNLARLLRQLKSDGHRCLIFTQMARMLDILESFLSYHGYTYLRLDGATGIEMRQVYMERFNQDSKIFCFILSTRSGGLGVNLTGADTVIFYDSDWNPTMDAQAQDRCHRIGQTKDVHIYRLICEKTVEENILEKASQKRKLGELAIDKGGFTAEFFQKVRFQKCA